MTSKRIKLDVCIDAPEIIVPLQSTSDEVILADLGKLRLANSFYVPAAEANAIAELYDIKLTDFKVTRCIETD